MPKSNLARQTCGQENLAVLTCNLALLPIGSNFKELTTTCFNPGRSNPDMTANGQCSYLSPVLNSTGTERENFCREQVTLPYHE